LAAALRTPPGASPRTSPHPARPGIVPGHGGNGHVSSPAVYRFLPWSRRGLVAELRDSTGADAGPLPFRGAIKLDVTLSGGLGSASTSSAIAGPGDVIGIDLGAIVRTTPRPNASNVEPNYLAAIDFDDADFPWLL